MRCRNGGPYASGSGDGEHLHIAGPNIVGSNIQGEGGGGGAKAGARQGGGAIDGIGDGIG